MKLVYLAPEIPALSATFVYNEMLAVEALGHQILPVSVHRPKALATDARLERIESRVQYLYDRSKLSVLTDHLSVFLKRPLSYLSALAQCVSDMCSVGLFNRNALGLAYRFFYAASLARTLNNEQIEHVHVHFAHVPTDIAMYATKMSQISFSVMAHANDIFERGLLLDKKVERASFFATISDFNRRYIQSTYHVDADKLEIIRCGVDANIFVRKAEVTPSKPLKLGVVGRLVEKKGLDTLIDAFAALHEQDRAVVLYIAGSGPLDIELKAQAERLGLTNFIQFLGPIPHDQVVNFVTGLDMFVLPCKQDKQGDMDGIPVVLMEAMMVGTPVISSDLSGIPELVIDQETGLLIEPGNSEQLAKCVVEIIDNQPLRKRLIEQAINKVQSEFAQNINAKRLEALFLQERV